MPHLTDPANNPFLIGDGTEGPGISITSNGVKLRGYGANLSDQPGIAGPLTRLKWNRPNAGTVVQMDSQKAGYDPTARIGNLEASDLTIDGDGKPGIGLLLNRVWASRFKNLAVREMRPVIGGEPGGIGIKLTTSAAPIETCAGVNTAFNYFESIFVKSASQGIVLDGNDSMGALYASDSTQNVFVNVQIVIFGTHDSDVGIWLRHCDANVFYRVSVIRGHAEQEPERGHAVLVNSEPNRFNVQDANANYFYHLTPGGGVHVLSSNKPLHTDGKTIILGHALGAGQPAPTTDSSTPARVVLAWITSMGEMHGFDLVE